jgi:hypothetical protein
LAAAFQARWAEARRRLFEDRDPDLADEVERLLRHHELDEAVRILGSASSAADLPRRFADLLAEMDPDLDPLYNGVRLNPAGLEAAALDVVRSGGTSASAAVLDEVRRSNILTRWRRLPGMAHGPTTRDAWSAADNSLDAMVRGLSSRGFQLSAAGWSVSRAWILLCVLDPTHHEPQLRALAEGLDATYASRVAWWAELRNSATPVAQVLSIVSHAEAIEQERAQQQSVQKARAQAAAGRRWIWSLSRRAWLCNYHLRSNCSECGPAPTRPPT